MSNTTIPQLIAATQGVNNEARNAASQQLTFLEDSRFLDYILELCRILGSNNEQSAIRVGAGLLLKNCIGAGTERSEQYINKIKKRWQGLQDNDKNRIKESILRVLALPDLGARDTAVNVISNLASIESLSQWKQLIPMLINKCLSKNHDLMYSSLKCISQIAENEGHHEELQQYSPKILECIAHGMSTNQGQNFMQVQTVSMECLYQLCELIQPNMSIEKERTIIFQMVCCGASNGPNKDLRLKSFMAIGRLIECYYDLLSTYMQSIFQISKNVIEKGVNGAEDPEVTKQAIEIWSTCAEIEYDINLEIQQYQQQNNNNTPNQPTQTRTNYGFVNKSLELLVPIYLKALLTQKDEFDEDEWTVRKAAACSLDVFAAVAQDNILNFVLKFVEQNVGSPNWRGREAALCAFGYILDGPSKEKLVRLTSQILPIILKLMRDNNVQVRSSAVWAFGRVTDLIPDAVGKKNVLQPIVQAIGDKNNIVTKVCWSIANLSKYYSEKNMIDSCIYSNQNAANLIRELLKRCNRPDSNPSVIIGTHEAINAVICFIPQNDRNKQMIESLLPELVSQTVKASELCKSGNTTNDVVMHKMAGLFSSIQVILDKLGVGSLNQDMTNKIMSCCCTLLQRDNDLVYEEALGCITYVAKCVQNNFQYFLESTQIQELLIKSVRIDNLEICRIGAGVIGDVYTSCSEFISTNPKKIQQFTDRIVSELLGILIRGNTDELQMQLKGHIVDALTDILIAHGPHAQRYSGDILDKCLDIGKLVPPQEYDEIAMEDFNEIRISIIDTCRTCMAELAASNQISNFQKYLPQIHSFFNAVSTDLNRVSVHVLKSCIKLLSEAADYCDQNTRQSLQTQAVQKILQKAGSMTNEPELVQQAKIAFQQISAN